MSTVKCSIVVPVYNGEKFLKETIDSCLVQSVNVEVIVVDDLSMDSSFEIMALYGERINVIKNTSNVGFINSCNIAAVTANSEYLLFIGQDDLLSPDHVEKMLLCFDEDTSFVWCNSYIIDSHGKTSCKARSDNDVIRKNRNPFYYLSKSNFISSTGLIIRRKCFQAVGGYGVGFKNYGEWDLWIKLLSVGAGKFNQEVIAKYRRHDRNMSKTFSSKNNLEDIIKYKLHCMDFSRSKINNVLCRGVLYLYRAYKLTRKMS